LIFVNNYTGAPFTHLWSIAVEFQFYLISPFVVSWLDTSRNPWIPPLIFFLVSTGLNFGFLYHICPLALERADVWEELDFNALFEGNDGCE
jgi:peptidoglycan/LPS O-acetylase OafA/YrhL